MRMKKKWSPVMQKEAAVSRPLTMCPTRPSFPATECESFVHLLTVISLLKDHADGMISLSVMLHSISEETKQRVRNWVLDVHRSESHT